MDGIEHAKIGGMELASVRRHERPASEKVRGSLCDLLEEEIDIDVKLAGLRSRGIDCEQIEKLESRLVLNQA
jgi:hypothetical protein